MRWGIDRSSYRVEPGLYRLGEPNEQSPILVTGNYKFTVDVVRRDTVGLDAWLLVLDTRGINVWCAAGKGTFGTKELITRILTSELPLLAESQTLILPQLGAPGVAAHEVRAATGYRVVYGPADIADAKAFIDAGNVATAEMRTVPFGMMQRVELAPVELVGQFRAWRWLVPLGLLVASGALAFAFGAEIVSAFFVGLAAASAYVVGVLAGGLFAPMLLPWIPGRMFALKGALLGLVPGLIVLLSTIRHLSVAQAQVSYPAVAVALGWALMCDTVASWTAMNFTGTSPITSPTGVERELRRWIPVQIVLAALGLVLWFGGLWLLGRAG